MTNLDIIRAWKDEEYRVSLSEEQRAMLPKHPGGAIELADELSGDILFPQSGVQPTGCNTYKPVA